MSLTDRKGLGALLTDRAFWLGLVAIGLGLLVFALLFNYAVMPIWTRHDAAVQVPDVKELNPDDAENALLLAGLEGEYQEQPYNPNVAADVVVDQSPAPGTAVKPGRRIYYYVNVSPKQLVAVPDVVSLSEGKAREDVGDRGLVVDRVEMDSMRTPYENTVTRQSPTSESRVPVGTRVTLWISPGVENGRQVTVPGVVGMTTDEARAAIREAELWVDSPRASSGEVTRQDPVRGETLKPGQEVRIYTGGDS
jgi:beta-lactam-binding protein with PASTA domain